MPLSYPVTLTQGTTANATDVQGNFDAVSTLLNTTGLDASYFQTGIVTNAYVSSSAAIAVSKLAAGTSGQVLLNTATPTPTWTTLSGDATVGPTGIVALGTGVIVNADVNATAAIDYSKLALTGAVLNADINTSAGIDFSKLAALTSGKILLGNGSNVATAVTPSGDVTTDNAGVFTIGAAKVTPGKLATGATSSSVLTSEARASASYGALSTAGPSVTVTIGANAACLVLLRFEMNGAAPVERRMAFAVSGASTIASTDATCAAAYYYNTVAAQTVLLTAADGLTAGSNTFTAQYRTDGTSATFSNRRIAVIPL